mgnify:CR=1 FL=1
MFDEGADGGVDDVAAMGDEAALDQFVGGFEVELLGFLVPEMLDKVAEVAGEHLAGVGGDTAGEVGEAEDADAVDEDFFAEFGAFDVAAGFDGHVDDDAAGLHALDHVGGEDDGGFASEDLGGGDDDIGGGTMFGHGFALDLQLFFGEGFGVAVLGLAGFAEIDFDEFGPEGLDLLLDDGPGVEGFDDGAKAFGGGDGLKPGDASSDDEDAAGGEGAGGGAHHGENFVEASGGEDYGGITAEVGLGAEDVHFLGDGGAGDHFQADRADPGEGELADELGLVEGVEVADMDGTCLELGDIHGGRLAEAKDDVGGFERGGAVGGNGGAYVEVGLVGDAEGFADVRFNGKFGPEFNEFLDGGGDDGDPRFTGIGFFEY